MKQTSIKFLLLSAFFAALTACGLSPQQVQPEPRLSGQLEQVANGQTFSLRLDDLRESQVIGYRGGIYAETNALQVNGADVFPRLQAETEAGMRMRGFAPVPAGQGQSSMRLSIAELHYEVNKDRTVASKVSLKAVLQVEVQKADQVYRGLYTANLDKGFVKPPTDKANQRLVSWVIGDALERVLHDDGLLQFMAR